MTILKPHHGNTIYISRIIHTSTVNMKIPRKAITVYIFPY